MAIIQIKAQFAVVSWKKGGNSVAHKSAKSMKVGKVCNCYRYTASMAKKKRKHKASSVQV